VGHMWGRVAECKFSIAWAERSRGRPSGPRKAHAGIRSESEVAECQEHETAIVFELWSVHEPCIVTLHCQPDR
jgi:hypothetical protein